MKKMISLIIAGAIITPCAYTVGYFLWHAWKNHKRGLPSHTMNPMESRLAAWWHRKELDRELDKILGPTESR